MAFVCLRAKATRHGKSRMKSEKAEAASLKPARDRKKKTSQHVNRRNVWLIVATVLLVLGSVFAFMPPQEKINQGLDIQGGLSVVLTAKSTSGDAVSSEDMEKSRSIIESRVNALGASEASVSLQGNDQILVQIPGLSDTEAALDTIGRTGKLEFARLDSFTDETVKTKIDNGQYVTQETVTDAAGNKFPTGKQSYDLEVAEGTYTPLVTGSDITRVTVDKESEASANYAVDITLNSEGAKAFEEATRDLAADHGKIVIILDGKVQSAPAVQGVISGGNVSITGNYTMDEAKALQTVLESGSLPVSFEYAQSQTVGPTLGQDALASGVLVAAIGLALVMLYLLVFYHGLGLITAAAMAVFACLYLGILALLSHFGLFSLSMAGIAGVVLTIGMAADSSILTLERFREEIRMGRSVRAASITGVRHGILTSIDARPGNACFRAHAVLPGQRIGQGLRPYARAWHSVRHCDDAAVQGTDYSPARAALHREASRLLGRARLRKRCAVFPGRETGRKPQRRARPLHQARYQRAGLEEVLPERRCCCHGACRCDYWRARPAVRH